MQMAELLLPVILGDSQVLVWAPGTHSHRAFLPHSPDGSSLCPHLHEHMKLLEGDYPSTALQPFCYLSRKELSLLISYQKIKSKLNVNKTLIKSYSSAF